MISLSTVEVKLQIYTKSEVNVNIANNNLGASKFASNLRNRRALRVLEFYQEQGHMYIHVLCSKVGPTQQAKQVFML